MGVTEESIAREALATIALSYVGAGDIHEQVWLDVLRPPQAHPVDATGRPLSWCRAAALYWIRERYRAAHNAEPPAEWIWIPGAGYERPLALPMRRRPQVGDSPYRERSRLTLSRVCHGAIVTRLHDDETIDTVDGNIGGVVVHRERTPLSEWDVFFNTGKLLI